MAKRETVGKVASELMEKQDDSVAAIEQMEENLTDYERNVLECVNRSLKDFPDDFYVVVETKKERLLPNVLRNYFFGRISCPTPTYDQAVYRFDRKEENLEFLWVIPSKTACVFFLDNMVNIPLSQRDLLRYVMDFNDNTLLRKAQKLNNEIT